MSKRPRIRIRAWPTVVIALALGWMGELAWTQVKGDGSALEQLALYLTFPARFIDGLQALYAFAMYFGDGPHDPALREARLPYGWLAPFASALVYLPFVHLARLVPCALAARRRARARVSTASAVLLLLLTLPQGTSAEEVETLRLLDRCPREQRACVRMTVSTEGGKSLITPGVTSDAAGHADFLVRVRGSLDGDVAHERDVIVRGFVAGIECTSFGQSTVAVVGLAPDGGATVLTTRGELRLETGVLRIGCAGCVEATELGRARVTPAADLTLTGHRPVDLFETRDGDLAVRQGDGCVVLGERFTWHPDAECVELRTDRPLELRGDACT